MQTLPMMHADLESTPLALSVPRAEEVSNLSRSTLYRMAAAGRLRMVKAGSRTLVDYASLRALLDSLPAITLKHAA